jgi:Rieske Fe-S protein
MKITRRDFVAGACALAAGCANINNAPAFYAAEDGSIPLPEALAEPMSQIKVFLRGVSGAVLVWRAPSGFGAAAIRCTHKGSEVELNPKEGTLDCPSHGSRFRPDGQVAHGPAQRPLKAYKVSLEGDRLRITG